MSFLSDGTEKRSLDYDTYRETAMDCDFLLWEPVNWYGQVVAIATAGPFCHASFAMWQESRLWDMGFNERIGGAARPLKGLVKSRPGKASVFRYKDQFDSTAVKRSFIDHLHEPYNWRGIRRLSLLYLLGVRMIPAVRKYVEAKLEENDRSFCSEGMHRAFICEAEYLVRKSSHTTTPNDLSQSPRLEYLGTLE